MACSLETCKLLRTKHFTPVEMAVLVGDSSLSATEDGRLWAARAWCSWQMRHHFFEQSHKTARDFDMM